MSHIKTLKGKFHYNRKTLYLGVKQIDKAVALENFKIVNKIFKDADLRWYPAFGTLLGIVREHDFIEWDEDIDLYILEEDEEKFRCTLWNLKEEGFELVRYERRGLYSIMRNGDYIDFYVLKKISNNLRHSNVSFIFEKYLNDVTTIDFKGVSVKIPIEYDEYLTLEYGDWRTPVKYANFELSKWQILYYKLLCYIKQFLPDFIYYPLLHRHHKKDFIKFTKRCKEKGLPLDNDINW